MHDIDRALFEAEQESVGETASELNETTELELAGELLEVTNEMELDRFLGDIFKNVVSAGRSFLGSDAGQAVAGLVKSAAKQALPRIGQALGNYIAPGVGGQFGSRAGSFIGSTLGLEMEGLSSEDREMEASRAFVRFANQAAQAAARAPHSIPPQVVAVRAATAAAKKQLPGLLPLLAALTPPAHAHHRAHHHAPAQAGQVTPRQAAPGQFVYGGFRPTPAQAPHPATVIAAPAAAPIYTRQFTNAGAAPYAAQPIFTRQFTNAGAAPYAATQNIVGGPAGYAWPEPNQSGRWVRRGTSIVLFNV